MLAPSLVTAWDTGLVCAYALPLYVGEQHADRALVGPPTRVPMCDLVAPAIEDVVVGSDARASLATARRLHAEGHHALAVLHLRAVAATEPTLADLIALEEGDYRMAGGPDVRACTAYALAMESPQRGTAARARIGHVRCLLAIGDRDGVEELDELRRRYSELPYRDELDLALGQAHEGWGEIREATQIYRRVDLMSPGSAAAAQSRARLADLEANGTEVRPLTPIQRVDRAERLVRSGPMDLAREEIAALRAIELPRPLAAQVARSAARIAQVEGRWDDASRLLAEARGTTDLDEEEQAALEDRLDDLARAAESREGEAVTRRIRGMTGGRPLSRLPTARLFSILRLASRARQRDVVDRVLSAIVSRDRLPPGLRFDAAILAAGSGDDAQVEVLFAGASRHPSFAVPARYHRGRALERLGRMEEARAEYARVIADDDRRLPYYAMWSRQRLRTMRIATARPLVAGPPSVCDEGPYSPMVDDSLGKAGRAVPSAPAPVQCLAPPPNPYGERSEAEPSEPTDPLVEADEAATDAEVAGAGTEPPVFALSEGQMIEVLTPIADAYGEAFPWLPRAAALIRIGELEEASDELHEVYTAWRDARGQGSVRAGVEGVFRGAAPPRHRTVPATWRARRLFPIEARRNLARVSAALGDHGMAIRFASSFAVAGPRPRAYEELVEAAAARHGVEPELLLAVMRVESVYNPRIISYAGAIGLMQIMPRTGRLIAQRQGREDFTVDQLLSPEINIDMAAWYLASLIERFDGRLPLAIASYNGGPHNVRRWMRDYSPDMQLDAFLERIPFDQTHRYVRRVMTHYEAYLAQRDRVIAPVDTRLPSLDADHVAF